MGEQIRIWEHWKQSGKSIGDYINWLATQKVSFSSFQRTAHHHRVTYRSRTKRTDGTYRISLRQRAFGKRELELLDAVYRKFGKYYGWFKRK